MRTGEMIAIMLIYVITILPVAKVNYNNGRIEQCNDLGLYHTSEGKCVTCIETGRLFIDGECVVQEDTTFDMMKRGSNWFNTTTSVK